MSKQRSSTKTSAKGKTPGEGVSQGELKPSNESDSTEQNIRQSANEFNRL